jgi:flavin-dependent dehydrogenase
VVVVGAGRSGTAAALTAAQAGQSVLLVDENPVPGHQIGNDVPLLFRRARDGGDAEQRADARNFVHEHARIWRP